ncbi:MAG: hypothetical protein HOP12_00520 [Candidatus Eisenbacteria bacterium]|uniref:Dockerin domain-containing protein n=1 Tax=Eiseniibacteriota bacterium TaxID=2212470 RepID=A0A849SL42_UNCEI|nr:hypothetical protein [Candidatus Eisenbacteria bacterium]
MPPRDAHHRATRVIVTCAAALLLFTSTTSAATEVRPESGCWQLEQTPLGVGLVLGASSGGVIDALVEKVIQLRRATTGTPCPFASVSIDFSECGEQGVQFCSDPLWGAPGTFASGATIVFSADANSEVRIRVAGHASASPAAATLPPCAQVYVDGAVAGRLIISTLDLDGHNGVDAVDLSRFLAQRFSSYGSRCDYNADGQLDARDLSILLRARFAGGSVQSCSPN